VATGVQAASIARGRVIKRDNFLTATACGIPPAIVLYAALPAHPLNLFISFVAGLLWANYFEYAYHRYLLHLPGSSLARKHLEYHMTVGAPTEAENVNLGSAPRWVALLFAINGVPVVVVDLLLGFRSAPGMLVAFTIYFIVTEELHWRIHLGEPLPPGLRTTRIYHLSHHARPDARFNIFLPLWDLLLRTSGTR
jgi:sterol desaturase/sphingolipid hydroxylase (fatty acid hydroxylase superfamily)